MSIDMISLVWNKSKHRGARRLMMLAIADYADENGMAWPSVSTLARKCLMSERYASDVLKAILTSKNPEVSVVDGGGGRFKSNLYKITLNTEARLSVSQNTEAGLSVSKTLRRGSKTLRRGSKTLRPASENPEARLRQTTNNRHRTTTNHHSDAEAPQMAAAGGVIEYWSHQTNTTPVNGQKAQLTEAVELAGESVVRELIDWAAGKGYTDTGRILTAARKRASGSLPALAAGADAESAWRAVSRYTSRPTPPQFDDTRIRAITDRIWPITKAQFVEEWRSGEND